MCIYLYSATVKDYSWIHYGWVCVSFLSWESGFQKVYFVTKVITSWNQLLALSRRRPLAFFKSDHMHLKVSVYSRKIHILNWHVWFSRYLYIPLGGSKWRFLNVWIIFTFVAIWHDLEWWVPYSTWSFGKVNLVRVQCNPDTSWLLQWDTLFSCFWSLGNGFFWTGSLSNSRLVRVTLLSDDYLTDMCGVNIVHITGIIVTWVLWKLFGYITATEYLTSQWPTFACAPGVVYILLRGLSSCSLGMRYLKF